MSPATELTCFVGGDDARLRLPLSANSTFVVARLTKGKLPSNGTQILLLAGSSETVRRKKYLKSCYYARFDGCDKVLLMPQLDSASISTLILMLGLLALEFVRHFSNTNHNFSFLFQYVHGPTRSDDRIG